MIELNKIYNEDCLEGMKRIPDGSVDMILCDLPYGTTNNKWDIRIDLESLWKQYMRICDGNILLFSQMPFMIDLINSNRRFFRYDIVWIKTMCQGYLNANKMPLRAHEYILVFYKKHKVYNPQKYIVKSSQIGKSKKCGITSNYHNYKRVDYTDTGSRFPKDVIEFSNWNGALFGNTDRSVKHPTQKPVDLCEYLIKTYTNEGDTVLDNCMGSGTTAVACINTGRNFIGFELEKNYYDISQERISNSKPECHLSNPTPTQLINQQLSLF